MGRPGSPQWLRAPLTAMHAHDHGHEAAFVGRVVAEHPGLVTARTGIGGTRGVDVPAGTYRHVFCAQDCALQ